MNKVIIFFAFAITVSVAEPKPSGVFAAAPLAVAPAVVTAQSSQVVARNYNALVAAAAPVIAAPAPVVAAAYQVGVPAVASPYVASPYVASPYVANPYFAAPAAVAAPLVYG